MPWALLIQAVQAVLVVAIQSIGRRQASAGDAVDLQQLQTLDPQHKAALCKLGELCAPDAPPAP